MNFKNNLLNNFFILFTLVMVLILLISFSNEFVKKNTNPKKEYNSIQNYEQNLKCEYPYKIMPLGDSITMGEGSTHELPGTEELGGYRTYLYLLLNNANLKFNFVGNQHNGPKELIDNANEGHPGYTIELLSDNLDEILSKNDSNLILLMIGTNDVAHNQDIAVFPSKFEALLKRIISREPKACIIVGSLTPILVKPDESWVNKNIIEYNQKIKKIVDSKILQGAKVKFVDMHSSININDDIFEGAHPNDKGYKKMAEVWYEAISSLVRK